jgi:hypothetical protein
MTSGTAAELAVDTQVGSNAEKDATIKQSSTSVIAAVSQARWINCRPILGSYVGSGLWIDKYSPFSGILSSVATNRVAPTPR